mmetsp:Transcript_3380/g.10394  ORF Transcript_3380/g.10394 Transcript_3380/m.10394 type:complete len:475 (+) Transcript_3380:340-1764(+)
MAEQRRLLLEECSRRYSSPLVEPVDFVAIRDRNMMALAREMLQEDSDHLDKLLPVIEEFLQLQIDAAPPELLVRVVEAFRYTHRPSYMLALTAITCEPQFQLFSERMAEIIGAAQELAADEADGAAERAAARGAPALLWAVEESAGPGLGAAPGGAEPTGNPPPATAGRASPPLPLMLAPAASSADGPAHRVTLRGGAIQRTAVLVDLHKEADGVDPLFMTFGAAVAQRSGGVFDAPPRDPLRTLETSALRSDPTRQWQCESVCVTQGTLKYGSVTKMTLGIELLLACDRGLAAISQLGTALLGTDAAEIEIVSIRNRFAEPTTGGWADVLVQFAFDADDNRHIVEVRLVHQDLSLVAEEHNAVGPYVKTRSALELLEAKGLKHRVPTPLPPPPESPSAASRSASRTQRESSGALSPLSNACSPPLALQHCVDGRLQSLEGTVQRLETTVADQARLIAAQGEMIKQLLAARSAP